MMKVNCGETQAVLHNLFVMTAEVVLTNMDNSELPFPGCSVSLSRKCPDLQIVSSWTLSGAEGSLNWPFAQSTWQFWPASFDKLSLRYFQDFSSFRDS